MSEEATLENSTAMPKAASGGGFGMVQMILLTVFVFAAAFGGSILAFQLMPKTVTVNQTIHEPKEPNEEDYLPMQSLGDFVVNLADVSGNRFLKMSITAKLYSEDFEEYAEMEGEEKLAYHAHIEEDISAFMPAIKDTVITVLSRKTADEVVGYENKIALKMELKEQLTHVMHGDFKVFDIYFTDFIVQ